MHLILHIILLLSVGVLGGMFITIVFDEYILSVSEAAADLLKRVKAREARESANYPTKKEREKSNEE